MARGYKLLDDPLEGILGNVLKLQKLQEGYEQGEQRKRDRHFNQLSSFQQSIGANLSNSDAMKTSVAELKSYRDNNKMEMDPYAIVGFDDALEMATTQISNSDNAKMEFNQFLDFPDKVQSLMDETLYLDSQDWAIQDKDGFTYTERAQLELGKYADITQNINNNLQYLNPNQQRMFIDESSKMRPLYSMMMTELVEKGEITPDKVQLLGLDPKLYLNQIEGERQQRQNDTKELNKAMSQIDEDLRNYEIAKNNGSVWKPKSVGGEYDFGFTAQYRNKTDLTKDEQKLLDDEARPSRGAHSALLELQGVLASNYRTKYNIGIENVSPVQPFTENQGRPSANLTSEQFSDAKLNKKSRQKEINRSTNNPDRRNYVFNNLPVEIKKNKIAFGLNQIFLNLTENLLGKGINPEFVSEQLVIKSLNEGIKNSKVLDKDVQKYNRELIDLYKNYTKNFKGKISSK
jgi:hypothetical protein